MTAQGAHRKVPPVRKPEILAPAGDSDCLHVALEAGADSVYFGLDEGFNARARATNFPVDQLAEVVQRVHAAGARAYLTLNTLVFEEELPLVEPHLRAVAKAGVDALIVQDPGLALLAKAVCPEMELHASTQMTISSPESARFAEGLGITRIVAPRELSVEQIRLLCQGTRLEVEVFVLGALCVSWSGQCLSSETWGGRSANRGQCAQACRLPYDLLVDGVEHPTGDASYLLSPKDLAGFRAVQHLVESGVHTFKVEGRQKSPAYVKTAVDGMRHWVDAVARGAKSEDEARLASDMRDLSLAYSRGFSDGFFTGSDHQTLVEGRAPRHRGILLGRVSGVQGDRVRVSAVPEPHRPVEGAVLHPLPALGGATDAATGPGLAPLEPRAGMGVVFDQGHPEQAEEGGPLFGVSRTPMGWELRFGRPGPDLRKVRPGDRVWVTGDPEIAARVQHALKVEPAGRIPLDLHVEGAEGRPLRVTARARGRSATACSASPLQPARGRALTPESLQEKLHALGGTPYCPGAFTADLEEGLFLPLSELKPLRRELVEALQAPAPREIREEPQLDRLRRPAAPRDVPPELIPLCRTMDHLEAVLAAGLPAVELDWMEFVGLGKAVERAREAGLQVGIATVRVQKPGEEVYDRRIGALKPDWVLCRHWAGVMQFADAGARVHGDFSLNVTNSLTAHHVLGLGLETVTAAHDLDEKQLLNLLDASPRGRVAVTIHHHIPTFHTEHCVYSHLLSQGRDYRTCGRPCERHRVSLRDRVGNEHPVLVDVECRNTVFNAAAQSAAFLVPRLLERGVNRFRVEFVRETREETERVLQAYRDLLQGRLAPADLVRAVGVHEQFGVTRGTMKVLSVR